MKFKSLIYTTLASALLFTSCDLNKQPTFDDATQAFIAFDKTSGMMFEKDGKELGTIELSLYCASLAGINASTEISFSNDGFTNPATEGDHFTLLSAVRYSIDYDNQSPTFNQRINVDTIQLGQAPYVINFDAEHQFAAIVLQGVDNDVREPNKKFNVNLTNIKGCNKGAMNSYTVTILDDETPFNRLLGEYSAYGESGFSNSPDEEWTLTINADEEVANKIWIHPFFKPFAGLTAGDINAVEATVDEVASTITMRLGQTLFGGPDESNAYNIVVGTVTPDGSDVATGGNAIAVYTIADDGVEISWNSNVFYARDIKNQQQMALYAGVATPVFTKN